MSFLTSKSVDAVADALITRLGAFDAHVEGPQDRLVRHRLAKSVFDGGANVGNLLGVGLKDLEDGPLDDAVTKALPGRSGRSRPAELRQTIREGIKDPVLARRRV